MAGINTMERAARKRATVRGRTGPGPARVVIEGVTPQIDAGRHPIKRIVGDTVSVEADVYKDGHDLLAARVCFRPVEERAWRHAAMRYDYNEDRWLGSFIPDRIGRWVYTVEAWTDVIGSWRSDLQKKADAGADVVEHLAEGIALIEAALREAKGPTRDSLRMSLDAMKDGRLSIDDRLRTALSPTIGNLLSGHVDAASLTRFDHELQVVVDRRAAGFAAWYEMFPRSQGEDPVGHGTFADAARRLPELAELGFDVIYLAPIHPIGHTNRKGPNNALEAGPDDPGSPWAIGSEHGGHTAIEPRLGTIDDFVAFVEEARSLGMEVALDYALQCSPDHPWAKEHPEWFFVRPDGSIKYAENPPKKYEDIYPLNFWCDDYEALWNECKEVFLYWMDKGVRIFRVDNPHTKPLSFWEWVIREIQTEHPDVIFLSEAFTRPKRMKGLAKLGFTQSYTYFTWRNSAAELREYLTELTTTEMAEYFRPNLFVNTPDILHEFLQKGGRPAFRIRLTLAATLSPLYGMYSGFELCENVARDSGGEEYLDSEKYQVREWDWDRPGHIKELVALVNRIRREQAALQFAAGLRFLESDNPELMAYTRTSPDETSRVLVIVNLDPRHLQHGFITVPAGAFGTADGRYAVRDLLSGATYDWQGEAHYVRLAPDLPAHIFEVAS